MIVINFYEGRLVGVLGLGRTGLATARSLMAGEARVIAWDDSPQKRREARRRFSALKILPPEAKEWSDVEVLVASPGISERHALMERLAALDISVTGDVELFGRALKANDKRVKVIAVTGTNGKSTVTALIAHILRLAGMDVEMGGNIGVPVLELGGPEDNRFYVLEVSSYQAGVLEVFSPDIAIQLNLTADHTRRHGSLEAYAEAKARLFARLGKKGLAIVNSRDVFGERLAERLKSKTRLIVLERVKLPKMTGLGRRFVAHERENIAACWAVAEALGISEEIFRLALTSFESLPHRVEEVARIGGVRFVNDSKATNAMAARQALSMFEDIYWLAGGAAKAEGFDDLRGGLGRVRHAYLFGDAAGELSTFLDGAGEKLSWSVHASLRDAVERAYKDACENDSRKGDDGGGVVLLSPACASFDAFTDFAERGRAFGEYIRQARSLKIYVAAGGTGGGIFPAQALAACLRYRGYQTVLMHDRRAGPYVDGNLWDRRYRISSGAIAGRAFYWKLWSLARMAAGWVKSLFILAFDRSEKLLVAFGGYPAVPPVLAGWLVRVPLILHEPGGVLGRANRFLLPLARRLAVSVPMEGGVLTGTPVRASIVRWSGVPYRAFRKKDLRGKEPFRLVIFGGSLGAAQFDEVVPRAMILVAKAGYSLRVVQQCRARWRESGDLYREHHISAEVAPFFDDLPRHIAMAHLVVARAGASTVNELALLGRPAILVPLGGAPAAEQAANAERLVEAGGAWLISSGEFTAARLARLVEALIEEPERLRRAARRAHALARELGSVGATDRLADLVEEVAYG